MEDAPDLYVRTLNEAAKKEYVGVIEIYFYDEDGNERVHDEATGLCGDIVTCGDMSERDDFIRGEVQRRLTRAGISFGEIFIEEEFATGD